MQINHIIWMLSQFLQINAFLFQFYSYKIFVYGAQIDGGGSWMVIKNICVLVNAMTFFSCFGAFDSCKDKTTEIEAQSGIITNNVRLFSFNSLSSATRCFHPSNRIGRGGFGVVYKGVMSNGTQVAIKSLCAESKQGSREFLTEINMISNVRHANLVQLVGCCIEGSNKILVYEYLENKSLASLLFGSKGKRVDLDWPKRAAICLGTASGLVFLHEEAHIVHRDVKASNVLLDENFHPKIGDFGLAKLYPDNVTHVSTRVAGTVGYLAPEYALSGQLTKKADVYSFGVLLLEIISGKSSSKAAFGEDLLVLLEWTWKQWNENRLLEIVDPSLVEYPEDKVIHFIKVALFCTQAASHQRPDMKQVVKMLSKDVKLNDDLLTEPGVYRQQTSGESRGSRMQISSSKLAKGEHSAHPFAALTDSDASYSITQMLPR
ncbi:Protein kinase superfamily protein [Abeliophyllum distichum]|uniref:Protein kinase superfamily protein n=1 Tax=Abeliophyllum distichum TaxID=126358 RepID=A0ABD1V947_9LAMI